MLRLHGSYQLHQLGNREVGVIFIKHGIASLGHITITCYLLSLNYFFHMLMSCPNCFESS